MLRVEIKQEDADRWIAEIPALPGVRVYGKTASEARSRAEALALRVLADRIEAGLEVPFGVRRAFTCHEKRSVKPKAA